MEQIRTGTGSHLSAFASEPTGTLFLPLVSHPGGTRRLDRQATAKTRL
jgi:hypothetical protein